MPANKILFANYPNFPKPKLVYIDSNFAVDLLYYEINQAANQASLTHRVLDCFAFYQQLVPDGVGLVGSVFTFSETLQLYANQRHAQRHKLCVCADGFLRCD
jgi:hypothetical protein